MKKRIIFSSILLSLVGCKTLHHNRIISEETSKNTQIDTLNSILSLEFHIYKGEPVDSISLINFSKVKGYLNLDKFTEIPVIPKGKLKCSLLDSNKQVIKSILIDHPLSMIAEYTEGNDSQRLHKETLKLEKKYFSLRTNYSPSMMYISFETKDSADNLYSYPLINLYPPVD